MTKGRDDFILDRGIAMFTTWREEFVVIEMAIYLAVIFVECHMFLRLT